MIFTGERYVPGVGGQIAYEHLHRYAFACDYVKGKIALDIASGEGYGSNFLAEHAARVVGIDVCKDAIVHAKRKYMRDNLFFCQGSCVSIPLSAASLDVVVSFETIEHLDEHERMLDEIRRVLKPDGTLIISSPNRKTYSDDALEKNKYHMRELYHSEFVRLLSTRFTHVYCQGQRLTLSSHMWPITAGGKIGHAHYRGSDTELRQAETPPFDPLYYIAVCGNTDGRRFPETTASLFTASDDELFLSYARVFDHLNDNKRYIEEQQKELAEKDRQLRAAWQTIDLLLRSRSWKITSPLRSLRRLCGCFRNNNGSVQGRDEYPRANAPTTVTDR